MEEEEIQKLQAQSEEYLAGWKRALADYDNVKKELAREKEEMRGYLKEKIAEQIIPVLDSFDQVNRHTPALNVTEDDALKFQNWLNGVRQTQGQLEKIMKDMGLEMVSVSGVFDPNWHEAVGQRTEEGKEEGQILDVAQNGWKLGDKLIRPAKVIINSIT